MWLHRAWLIFSSSLSHEENSLQQRLPLRSGGRNLELGIGCKAEPDSMPAASEEAGTLKMTDVALADLEVTLEDKLGLNLVGAS